MSWEAVLKVAEEFENTIKTMTPDLYDEMRGIADGYSGAGKLGVLDVIALNSRSEIALGMFSDGCTSVAWRIENAEGGKRKQYLCQNWDWSKEVKENLAIMSIERDGKPKIVMVTEVRLIAPLCYLCGIE
jgi:isopenicillin-N N-acyltransferase-like protein